MPGYEGLLVRLSSLIWSQSRAILHGRWTEVTLPEQRRFYHCERVGMLTAAKTWGGPAESSLVHTARASP